MKGTSLVYRLEHKDTRKGCFNTTEAYNAILRSHSLNDPRHPMPDDDSAFRESEIKITNKRGHCRWSGDFRFCFLSVEQLRAWFYMDNVFAALQACDIVLSVYQVQDDTLVKGSTQAAFHALCHTDECRVAQYDLVEWVKQGFCKN